VRYDHPWRCVFPLCGVGCWELDVLWFCSNKTPCGAGRELAACACMPSCSCVSTLHASRCVLGVVTPSGSAPALRVRRRNRKKVRAGDFREGEMP
jgi:hypothetical protein